MRSLILFSFFPAQAAPAEPALPPLPRPEKLAFSSWDPSGESEARTLALAREQTFGEARISAGRLFQRVPPGPRSIFFCQEGRHLRGEELRSYIFCYDPESDSYVHIDVRDGQQLQSGSETLFIRRFLLEDSDLPRSPRLVPGVICWNDSELLELVGGEMKVAPEGALGMERFVAHLWGIKCGRANPLYYWAITDCGEQGKVFCSPEGEVIVGREGVKGAQRTHFWLLLKEGDQLPRISVPAGRYLQIWQRLGSKLDLEDGRLAASPAPFKDLARWEATAKVSDIIKKVTAAARR